MGGEYSFSGEQGCDEVWADEFVRECDVEGELRVIVECNGEGVVLVLVWLVEQVSGFLDELYGVLYSCLVNKWSGMLKPGPRRQEVEQEDGCKSETENESKDKMPVMRCMGGSDGEFLQVLAVDR